ncbi:MULTISPECIES: bifunctional hydroxymethylpyrimidine kinase/phosphomethylpyrimidine kinase [Legionella]|uniref:hydroxymethylpyrimidine kinase n=1 Tax=Legionella maceachernii TaxID=466 RepID=A0A0W0W3U0_9GAMM|nr:bifunctional hydroxymethylpyrimidine kinase/phosphomethylpyrimidine kinase [Legionella maceachernii]KTD27067.1 bifunctional hydroxy-methylpyrimidine kinase and hydroxy-phosphomethylpyrimidine kinase [Legionella maceachernii]SKA04360.1 hydroxymethylpyrimidine/phosphomethylpyrimidine kinase [Legionella maceachernii]SUP00259.1 Hydroxymethylpyrimidine/phosphomethylpyrimidine kinase [Legionella maceachernii]
MQHKALSIAGFDGSGGAGIQADLKTFSAFGCYGMTVLTALPVQNTQGVKSCYELPLRAIDEQLHAIFEDIRPDSIKIGMLFQREIVELVADFINNHAKGIPVVLDPVTVAKSGDSLLEPDALNALKNHLIPLTTLITPNLPEAKTLLGPKSSSEMVEMAQHLLEFGTEYVLLKGGHAKDLDSNDLLLSKQGEKYWLGSPRIDSKNTHGTGCTLSAAIASCLALGFDMLSACQMAKSYIFQAIDAAKNEKIGKGFGPVHHFYHLWPTIEKIKGDNA